MYSYISRQWKNYSTVKLLDDYHHILRKYYNQMSAVFEILVSDIGLFNINIHKSIIFLRNNRNRQYCVNKNDTKING